MNKRTDANHTEIVKTLKKLGYVVYNTYEVGNGFPDIVCFKNGEAFFIEVKTKTGVLLDKQKDFLNTCKNSFVVKNLDDCILLNNNPSLLKKKYQQK
jgi:hypothetical protein